MKRLKFTLGRIVTFILLGISIAILLEVTIFKDKNVILTEPYYLFTCDECRKMDKDYTSLSEESHILLNDNQIKEFTGESILNTNYYDSKGKIHNHSYSYYSTNFICSNGHKWELAYFYLCHGCNTWPNGYIKLINGKQR